jgi:hypothetical protein
MRRRRPYKKAKDISSLEVMGCLARLPGVSHARIKDRIPYHPSYLKIDAQKPARAWQDQLVQRYVGKIAQSEDQMEKLRQEEKKWQEEKNNLQRQLDERVKKLDMDHLLN